MKRLPIVVVALIVILLATAVTGVGVAVATRDDHARARVGPEMMQAGSTNAGGRDDSPNSMMRGPLTGGSHAALSEPEYLAEMVAHHQEAVTAGRQLVRSGRLQLRVFGQSVADTQSAQIEQMLTWLSVWYPNQSTTVDYRPMMRDLSDLSGDRLDRVFLRDMITHHMAAVMMSQHLLRRGVVHEEITALALSIRDDQHAEIIQMQRWLTQWFDTSWHGTAMGRGMWSDQGLGIGQRMMRSSTS